MKTTLELPDELLAAAKAAALRRRTSLKALFTRALERELRGGDVEHPHPRFKVDEAGWPVLQADHGPGKVIITDSFINDLRETEGV